MGKERGLGNCARGEKLKTKYFGDWSEGLKLNTTKIWCG